jgi:hypothetical protein
LRYYKQIWSLENYTMPSFVLSLLRLDRIIHKVIDVQ